MLKRSGKLYTGFGPLYKSPYGGHRRMKMPIPWGHLILPESMLMKWVSKIPFMEEHFSHDLYCVLRKDG